MTKYFVYRSSITGRFVSKAFAEKNPDTTERQLMVRRSKCKK